MPPRSDSYFVLDPRNKKTIFGIDLNTNTVSGRYLRNDNIVAIQYDAGRNWIYEAVGNPTPGLDIYDVAQQKYVQKLRFPGAPSALLFHPLQRKLYLVSEDSTNFRYFDLDSMKIMLSIGLHIQDRAPIRPATLSPGPLGKLITANSAHPSVTAIFTENSFMHQTVIIHNAQHIDNAVFSFDGNSTFCCDTQQGAIFRVEFGTGKVLAEKYQLRRPRLMQIEVLSNTVVYVEGNTDLVMLNPDTFRETGRVSLAEYGDDILSLLIPPRANYAEVLLDYKGVTRWMRFDIYNWEPTRFVELI
ncbi:MAG: hypothetical protein WBP29_07025 [Candidatus Zixiibacteriota bacterium]